MNALTSPPGAECAVGIQGCPNKISFSTSDHGQEHFEFFHRFQAVRDICGHED